MSITLSQILTDANATLDLEATAPTGDELTLRTNYANQAIRDAASTNQFSEFKSEYIVASSTLATIAMPSDFRELMMDPQLETSAGTYRSYREVKLENKYDQDLGDYYCYVLGNPQDGYNIVFNNLTADLTLHIPYQKFPTGFNTLTSICEIPDPTYVVRKIESYVLYSRGDERFPTAESRAEQTLLNMVGREYKSPGGQGADTKAKFNNPLR